MITQLKCLVVEDDPVDFQFLEHHLRQAVPGGFCQRVERLADFQAALEQGAWDVVLSDYKVPGLVFQDTLGWLQIHYPELPLILVSGTIGEELAVELLKQGVTDFVLKNNLRRLVPAIERSLNDIAGRRARLVAEERYRCLFDNMLNGCAHGRVLFEQEQPRDFVYLAVNQAFENLTGRKGVVGRRLTEVVPDLLAGNPQFFEPYGRVVRTGIPEKYESYVVALQQWFAVALYRTAPEEFMAVFDVITERKQAEESLRHSQAVYRSLVTQLPIGIYQKDLAGHYLVVNPTLCQLRGLPAETFLGKSALEVARAENSKPGPGALVLQAALARENHHHQILQTGQPLELEEEFILADGRREFMHVLKLPVLDVDGRVIGTQGVLFNVTARKRAEAALQQSEEFKQAILDAVNSNIAVLDPAGVILAVNARWQEFAATNSARGGLLPRNTGPGSNYLEVCRLSRSPEALAAHDGIVAVVAGRQESFTIEYRCDAPLKKRWFSMVVTRLGAGPQVVVSHTNITERRRSEELLRESEQQFRAMFETAAAGMAQADPGTGQLVRVNRKLCAITGYSEAELLELRVPDITHPADRDADWALFQSVIRGEQPEYHIEKRYVRKDGAIAWVNINMTVLRDDAGQPVRTMAVIEDITERKRSEELLREGELQLRAMFETAAVGMVQTDPRTGRFLRVNRKMCAITGYSEAELLGMRVPDISHPADRETSWLLFQSNVGGAAAEHHLEKRYRRKDGAIAWVNINATLIRDESGQPVRTLAVIEDITDRRIAEEKIACDQARFKLIFDSVPIGIAYAIVQPNGQLQRITNAAHLKIAGLTAEADQQSGVYQRITHPEDWERQQALLAQLGPDRVGAYTIEKRYCRPDGLVVWVAFSYKRQPQPDGSFADLTTVVDITERKLVERALRESEMAFRTLAESMPQIVWSCNADGLNTYFNQQWMDYTGLSLAESLGHGWNIPFHPEEQKFAWEAWQAAVQTGGTYALETRLRRADGVYRWWLVRGLPQRDAHGTITKWFGTCTDIDDLKRAEAALRTSRAKLDAALASMTDAVFIADAKGESLEFNDAFATFHKFENISECPRQPDDYHPILEKFLLTGELVPLNMWAVPRALRGETVTNAEYTFRRKDTGVTWVGSCSFGPIRDAAGTIVGAVVVARDITARKREEQTMRLTQFSLEHCGNAIWWIGPDGNFIHANQAASQLVGYAAEDIKSLFVHDFNPSHPPAAWARHWQELREKKVLKFEAPIRTRDGRLLTVELTANYLEFEGREFNCAFMHDITERKAKTEELLWKTAFLEALVHSSADGILVVDNQRRKILQNKKLVDFWRLPPEIAANPDDRQQFAFALSQARDPLQLEAQFQRVMSHPDEPDLAEIELKDGTVLERYTAQVHGNDGRIYGRVWTFHNITRSRQLEAQYRQAQKMEAIGTLAGGIAHDFNNILCSMFGYGYLAQQEISGHPLANEYLAEILKAANRARDLVQQILTFSRQREQKREVVRLETVVKEATKFLRASLPADLQIEINLDEEAPAVLADPTQIYQVVMNLGTNALHAMEGRPGRLVVSLETFVPDEAFRSAHPEILPNLYTRLTVMDNGQGMDARTLERIFEPFFTTKPVGKGTGLGLAVVHGIVQAHDGFITVASQPGVGTTFELFFPAQTTIDLPPENPAGSIPRGQGQRILLLDDESALTGPFKGLLERLNYRVTVCNLASEAIRCFCKNPAQFDLLITDLTMPEISGLEVARQLHGIRADLPVILATGYAYSISAATLKEAGISELLEKPMALTTLALAVQRVLGKK